MECASHFGTDVLYLQHILSIVIGLLCVMECGGDIIVPSRVDWTTSLPRPTSIPAKIQTWREHLLKDMTHLPKIAGQKPGRIVVKGHTAAPMLKGVNNEHVVMAAAEVGDMHGRIVVFSHDQYISSFGRSDRGQMSILHENVQEWVGKGEATMDQHIVNLSHGDADFANAKVLLWHSHENPSEEMEKKIREHVMNGGGLVYALCSHAWKTKNPRKEMSEVPLGSLLSEAGIVFCESKVPYCDQAQGFSVSSSDTLYYGHGQHLLQECLEEKEGAVTYHQALLFFSFFRDVPQAVVDSLKDQLELLFRKCHQTAILNLPRTDMAVKDKQALAAIIICNVISELGLGYKKMPGIDNFPGDFSEEQETLKCAELEIQSTGKDTHPTGFWVPAGATVEIELLSQKQETEAFCTDHQDDTGEDESAGWTIRIGAHSDKLYEKEFLLRWPYIMVKVPLKPHQEVFTPFGGLLYFMSPDGVKSTIKVKISGVVEAPYFDLKDPQTMRNWETKRHAPGLWADICGNWFRITVPSTTVRELTNLEEVMQTWDQVVLNNHDLRGTEPFRREWVVADIQPVMGKLHSGHPIVSGMNMADPDGGLSLERLTTIGCWGIFHELGHNVQRKMWTFDGTQEVTCNIFSLYESQMIGNQPLWLNPWFEKHMDKIQLYLDKGPTFEKWQKQKGVALTFYAQLAHHFGWGSYKKVFRGYEEIPPDKRPKQPQVQLSVDTWVVRFSLAVGYNLTPLADFWAIPVSREAKEKLASLKPFLPDDEMIRMAPKRVQMLEENYPGLVRNANIDE